MKNSFVLFGGSGKVGNLVAYSSDGRKLVRSRNFSPANPRTAKQAIQRMVLAAVTSYARAFAKVVDNSFDGYKNGNGSLSRFRSLAMRAMRPFAIDSTIVGAAFYPKGSASIQPVKGVQVAGGNLSAPKFRLFQFSGSEWVPEDDSWPASFSTAEAYKAWLSTMGLQDGDQLTFVAVATDSVGSLDPVAVSFGFDWPLLVPFVARICFKKAEDLSFAGNVSPLVFRDDNYYFNPALVDLVDGDLYIAADLEDNAYTGVAIHAGGVGNSYQMGVIRTSYVDGQQVHSNAFLMSDTGDQMDDNTASLVYGSYMGSVAQPSVESPYYTENAQ